MKKEKILIGSKENIRQYIVETLKKENRTILCNKKDILTLDYRLKQLKNEMGPKILFFMVADNTKQQETYSTYHNLFQNMDEQKFIELHLISYWISISDDIDGIIEKDIYIGYEKQLKEYGIDIKGSQDYYVFIKKIQKQLSIDQMLSI